MTKVFAAVDERFVNPLFEVFDGGDLILSSYRDIERPEAEVAVYFENSTDAPAAKAALADALAIVGAKVTVELADVPDEDWKFAYRRHFKPEAIGQRLVTVPEWERETYNVGGEYNGRLPLFIDPGLAFGTGKHETTRACLEYLDELSAKTNAPGALLDMGTGSGILAIAAEKLGYLPVEGFDVDEVAVVAARENALANGVCGDFYHFALGRDPKIALAGRRPVAADTVVANILGPLLIRFADEIVALSKRRIVISGILSNIYAEVLAAYETRGFKEVSHRTIGEWTTGLVERA